MSAVWGVTVDQATVKQGPGPRGPYRLVEDFRLYPKEKGTSLKGFAYVGVHVLASTFK